jgi:hypothetical protein
MQYVYLVALNQLNNNVQLLYTCTLEPVILSRLRSVKSGVNQIDVEYKFLILAVLSPNLLLNLVKLP